MRSAAGERATGLVVGGIAIISASCAIGCARKKSCERLSHARPGRRRLAFQPVFQARNGPSGFCRVPPGTHGTLGTTGLSGPEQQAMFRVAVPDQNALFQVFQVFRPEHLASRRKVLRDPQPASAAPSKMAAMTT